MITPKIRVCFCTRWFVVLNKQTQGAEKVFSGDHTGLPGSRLLANPRPASGELIRADILSNVWEERTGRHTCWEGGISAECVSRQAGSKSLYAEWEEGEEVINKAAEEDETKV